MKNFLKKIVGLFLILSGLSAQNIMAELSGSPATILVEATKTVMGVGETNNIYVTVNNPTGSAISGIVVAVAVPAGFTVNSTVVPSGTTFPNPYTTWTFTSSLAANTSKTLVIRATYTGVSGVIVTPTATFTAGSSGSSDINILIGCPFINWDDVEINSGNIVQFNNANVLYNENLASQGVAADFAGFRKNVNPPMGYPQYTARFQNLNITNLGRILQFNNANPQSDPSGNNPYQIVNPTTGEVDLAATTSNPPNYLEGKFTFDPITYPNGLAGISFFIYDIDAQPTKGWQDAVIVYGTDINGDQVRPITSFSAITTVYNVNALVFPQILDYALNIGGKGGLIGYDSDNPRGRVTYSFPQFIRSFDVRYFRNSQINSEHYVWLSNLYRGCGTVLDLNLAVAEAIVCEECFTFTLTAQNEGPSDVLLAVVTGVVPEGLTVQNYTASKGTFDPVTGEWEIGSLMVGESQTLAVEVCSTLSSITWDLMLLGDGSSDEVHRTISVTYAKALNDVTSTLENVPVIINWAANDYSVGGTLDLNSFSFTPPSVSEGVVTVPSPGSGLCTFTPATGFVGTVAIPYTVSDSNGCTAGATIYVMVDPSVILPPTALNDAATTPLNTPVDILVLANDLTGSAPLNPASVTIITQPLHGSPITPADINPITGAVTYTPNSGFIGTDSFVYQVCDTNFLCTQATVYITVFDPNAPCPSICPSECCGGCIDPVNESMATPVSFTHFVQVDGAWTQVGDHINTVSNGVFANFLRHYFPVSQAFEIIECEIEMPSPQLASQPDCRVGIISHWSSSHSNVGGPCIVYFNFATDVAGNLTGVSSIKVDTHLEETPTSINFPLVLGQTYKMRLVKIGQQTTVFIDDIFTHYDSNSGTVAGNYIGVWAHHAEANFKNFTSCSYRTVPPTFNL